MLYLRILLDARTISPVPMSSLPAPSADARAHSERVAAHIRGEIARAGGWISFARFMDLALYAPGLGYYMAGARKLGAEGDFTTAPELGALYGHTLARAAAEALAAAGDEILEIGAGTGALAASLLEELERLGRLPRRYLIVELSPELRARQPRHARCARAAPDGARGVAERASARGVRFRHR